MVGTAPIFVGDVVGMRPFLPQTADQADQCKFLVVFSAMARHPNGNPVVSVVQPVVVPVTAAAAVSSAD